jgi:hypothetical protein
MFWGDVLAREAVYQHVVLALHQFVLFCTHAIFRWEQV